MFHSPQWSASLAARPGCQVIAVDAGHWVVKNDPAAANDAIARWLAKPELQRFACDASVVSGSFDVGRPQSQC